jgi:hypothetical protein
MADEFLYNLPPPKQVCWFSFRPIDSLFYICYTIIVSLPPRRADNTPIFDNAALLLVTVSTSLVAGYEPSGFPPPGRNA